MAPELVALADAEDDDAELTALPAADGIGEQRSSGDGAEAALAGGDLRGARWADRDEASTIKRIEPEEAVGHEVDGGRAGGTRKSTSSSPGHRAGAAGVAGRVEIEAVHSKRVRIIGWRELLDVAQWRRGWD